MHAMSSPSASPAGREVEDEDGQQGVLTSQPPENAKPKAVVVRDREYYAWWIAELNHRVNSVRKLLRKRRTPKLVSLLEEVVSHRQREQDAIEKAHSPKESEEDDPWVVQRKDVYQPPFPDAAAGAEGLTETYASCVIRGPRMEGEAPRVPQLETTRQELAVDLSHLYLSCVCEQDSDSTPQAAAPTSPGQIPPQPPSSPVPATL